MAAHPAAAASAHDILIEGGTAIEAAVAAAAVCAVVLPERAGLGADGLWLVREPGGRGRTRVIDARGVAGEAASLRSFRDREQETIARHGTDSVLTVPGSVGGWAAALDFARTLGARMPVARLLEPAVRLARDGVRAPAACSGLEDLGALLLQPGFAAAFLVEDQWPPADTLRIMPRLAETLGYLAHAGLDDLYVGDVGREIASDLERFGSPLTRTDLKRFEARWRVPRALEANKRRVEVPPTGRALALLLTLGLGDHRQASRPHSVGELHMFIEAFGRARALMSEAVEADGDPDHLLSDRNLAQQAETIDGSRAQAVVPAAWPEEDGIFIGVIDSSGLAVSLVQSLGTTFGAGVVLPGTGVLMGNRGAAFALSSQDGLVLRSGRRAPMSSVPILTSHDDGRISIMGATGAGAAAVAALAAIRLQSGSGLADSVDAPRLAPGWSPDSGEAAWLAEDGFDTTLAAGLRRLGHPVETAGPAWFGEAGALLRHAKGRIDAAADSRFVGATAGF